MHLDGLIYLLDYNEEKPIRHLWLMSNHEKVLYIFFFFFWGNFVKHNFHNLLQSGVITFPEVPSPTGPKLQGGWNILEQVTKYLLKYDEDNLSCLQSSQTRKLAKVSPYVLCLQITASLFSI